jgi:uncharacterized protein (TIGR02996 family)
VDEEAGFIAAMLADPDDRTVLLVYADWLDEHNDPRAEYLRLIAKSRPNQRRLAQLRRRLDPGWLALVATRHLRVGRQVRVLGGVFRGLDAELTAITLDRRTVTVRVIIWGRPIDVQLVHWEVEHILP